MADQAEKLRELVQEKEHETHAGDEKEIKNIVHLPLISVSFKQRTIAVTSGKGGVGKTNFTANLSIALAQLKKEVLLLDADLGLANLDVIFGLRPQKTLHDVIMEKNEFADVLMNGPEGIKIIPGASGIQELADLSFEQRERFLRKLSDMETNFDALLIDTGAGLSQNVLSFCLAAGEVIVVTTPEPTAYMDAYSTIKVLSKENPDIKVRLMVNMVSSEQEALQLFDKISNACWNFLRVNIVQGGYLVKDHYVTKAVLAQKPFILLYPDCQASQCIREMASKLFEMPFLRAHPKGLKGFFRRFVYSMRTSSPTSMAPLNMKT